MLFIAHSLDSTTAQLEVTEALYEGCKIREGYYDSLLVSHTLIIQEQKDYIQSLKEEIADAKGREDSLKVENAKIAIKYKLSREEINNIPDTVLRDSVHSLLTRY